MNTGILSRNYKKERKKKDVKNLVGWANYFNPHHLQNVHVNMFHNLRNRHIQHLKQKSSYRTNLM